MEQLTQFLVICNAITVIGGAVAVISTWKKHMDSPRKQQDKKIENINKKLDSDYKSIRNTKEDMNLLMRSMFNLIENKITGNNIEGLKKTREELVNAMTDKKA